MAQAHPPGPRRERSGETVATLSAQSFSWCIGSRLCFTYEEPGSEVSSLSSLELPCMKANLCVRVLAVPCGTEEMCGCRKLRLEWRFNIRESSSLFRRLSPCVPGLHASLGTCDSPIRTWNGAWHREQEYNIFEAPRTIM